jgi:SAM-dependent methyltransferase
LNALENWFCATAFWQRFTQRKLLPWILAGVDVGDHVLELGSGPGAGTEELARRARQVTSIEYSHAFAANLAARQLQRNMPMSVLRGDAAVLPFADGSFSSAVAVLMLHHLRSSHLQRCAFGEIRRVLRPGGIFLAFEIRDGWMQRAIHHRSTFVPVDPATAPSLLAAAGFSQIAIDARAGGFRICATRGR